MVASDTPPVPEQGQLVRLRGRFWSVQDVVSYSSTHQTQLHRVLLECLDDDQLGEALSVLWEREIAPQIYASQELARPTGWDTPARFQAFVTTIQWASSSVLEKVAVQAPFYSSIDIEEYQLEPVVRALTMPRVNLLIADDVGLGKTIEAGLVVQEMLARRRIRRVMVVCPASLQQQWQDEMREKFQLDFQIIDRDTVQRLRREFGLHVNPWLSSPRLITSMDFLKREQPLRLFRESLQSRDSALRDWDLLIVDEAHNVAPSGRTQYAVDSDRTRMMRNITDHFEHRLFLTATPHNGFTESFTALLELLDPLRFSRGPQVNAEQVQRLMVRRLKEDIQSGLGRRKFAERHVEPLTVNLSVQEHTVHDLLDRYSQSRLSRLAWNESLAVRFALTMLKKRLLSSPQAFAHSIQTHMETLNAPKESAPDAGLLERMAQRASEDWSDDAAKALVEEDALVESSRFFTDLNADEQNSLRQMSALANNLPDAKLIELIAWIEAHLRPNQQWNSERLVIFTEYKDTLDYLLEHLEGRYGKDRLLSLFGGMGTADRERIKAIFQADPDDEPARILVATDAASEGLNLQNHCHYLIHYEIPWNPNRMEQRNGRIDRHGQKAEVVTIYHFLFADHADSRFLQTVVEKVQTMRADLGPVGEVIAAQVEEAMLGQRQELNLPERRQKNARDVVRAELMTDKKLRELRRQMERARDDLSLKPETMTLVLDEALKLLGQEGLLPSLDLALAGRAFRLRALPTGWKAAAETLKDARGHWRDVTFDRDAARGRRDVALLHLNHPVMRLAMGAFRARLWSDGEGGLNRVSYRVLPDLSRPVMLAYGRVVAVGESSQRLHESVICVGGEIDQEALDALETEDIERLLRRDYHQPQPKLPSALAGELRRLFPHHERTLRGLLEAEREWQEERLHALANNRAEEDAQTIEQLILERIRELEARLKDANTPYQLALPIMDVEERQQYEEDTQWLRRKQDDLRGRLKTEPEAMRRTYSLRSVRVFPLAVLYLLPEDLLREGGR